MADFDWSGASSGAGGLLSLSGGLYSGISGAADARKESAIQTNIINLQMQADQQRRTQMELNARRSMLQNVRQGQMARSMALATAEGQGAQFSSGLAGAYGSISGQTNTNQLGISQNLQIGEQLFNINESIDEQKIALSKAEAQAATDKAWGGLMSSAGNSLSSIFKGAQALAPLFMV